LMLADLDSLERRTVQVRKRAQGKDKESLVLLPVMEEALKLLQDGKPVRLMLQGISAEALKLLQGLNLLTSKPVLYVCNVAEKDAVSGNEHTAAVERMAAALDARTVTIPAAIAAAVVEPPGAGEQACPQPVGLREPGLG